VGGQAPAPASHLPRPPLVAALANTCSATVRWWPTCRPPELVENRRRSIAMLPPGAPALNRDEALELLEQLNAALLALRKLRTQGEVR
jgi:hypothetical protein